MICPTCKNEFQPRDSRHKHCSTWCGKRDRCKCGNIKVKASKGCKECKKIHSRHKSKNEETN